MPRLTAVLTAVLLLAACGESEPTQQPSVVDDLGRQVVAGGTPQRLVSLAPGTTEMLFAAGLGDRLVGVTDADDYPEAVSGIARIQALPLNHEAVVALQPDLVFASDQINDPRDAEALSAVGIPTYFVSVQSIPDLPRGIRALGARFGSADAANAYADSLERTLAELDTRREEFGDTLSTIFLIGDETLFSFGPESYVHDMIAIAGGRSLTADLDTEAPILSEEFVLAAAPDVILTAFDPDPARLLALHPAWSTVPAIRNGRVHMIPADEVLRAGPRIVAGTRSMSEAIQRRSRSR
ncbi:MAG: ABC transporter substrate-binding protein [Rhodothermales bacterium]|nr:ABC transporter substrate-binding protein [Rhodothermales bacterium]